MSPECPQEGGHLGCLALPSEPTLPRRWGSWDSQLTNHTLGSILRPSSTASPACCLPSHLSVRCLGTPCPRPPPARTVYAPSFLQSRSPKSPSASSLPPQPALCRLLAPSRGGALPSGNVRDLGQVTPSLRSSGSPPTEWPCSSGF